MEYCKEQRIETCLMKKVDEIITDNGKTIDFFLPLFTVYIVIVSVLYIYFKIIQEEEELKRRIKQSDIEMGIQD
jgi:hypothetical protein